MAGLIRRDGLPSGEGGPRAKQHVLPLMAQFVDDNKGNSGSKLTKKKHREESERVYGQRERDQRSYKRHSRGPYYTGRNEQCPFHFHE